MIVAGTPIERPSIREAGYLQLERGGVSHSIGWAGTLDVGNVDVDEYHAAIVEQLRRRIDVLPWLRQRPVALPRLRVADLGRCRRRRRCQPRAHGHP
jgi:hypothetical protein